VIRGEYDRLVNYEELGRDAMLSIPTSANTQKQVIELR